VDPEIIRDEPEEVEEEDEVMAGGEDGNSGEGLFLIWFVVYF
jgi:hypothetical protein